MKKLFVLIFIFSQLSFSKKEESSVFYHLVFKEKKDFSWKKNGSLAIITISNIVDEKELSPIFHQYENPFVSRIFVKNIQSNMMEITFVLKKEECQFTIDQYSDPFRLKIWFFNKEKSFVKKHSTDHMNDKTEDSTKESKETKDIKIDEEKEERNEKEEKKEFQRKLIQPYPDLGQSQKDWQKKLENISEKRAEKGLKYPIYMYPLNISLYEKLKKSGEPLADYAYHLYILGQETRSLTVYQELLHKNSTYIEESPLDMWIFAELHFVHGNLDIAEGYYERIIKNFDSSPFSLYAKVRKMDISFLENQTIDTHDLESILSSDVPSNILTSELIVQCSIRKSFWFDKNRDKEQTTAPLVDDIDIKRIEENLESLEHEKTKNIASAIALSSSLYKEFSPSTIHLAQTYWSENNHLFEKQIKENFEKKLIEYLEKKETSKKYDEIIEIYQSLHKSILVYLEDSQSINWIIAEAYRQKEKREEALVFYQRVSKEQTVRGYKSLFWAGFFSKNQEESKKYDDKMFAFWKTLSIEDKKNILTDYRTFFEDHVTSESKMITPAKNLLSSWMDVFHPKLDAQAKFFSQKDLNFQKLKDLSQKFEKLGLERERRQVLSLLKEVQKDDFDHDKEQKKLWIKEILSYAEELRKKDEYIESGELYLFAADHTEIWENRSEHLYKAGLLLERAGKRDEAIKAFERASQDKSNLLYANLAKERLNHIKK